MGKETTKMKELIVAGKDESKRAKSHGTLFYKSYIPQGDYELPYEERLPEPKISGIGGCLTGTTAVKKEEKPNTARIFHIAAGKTVYVITYAGKPLEENPKSFLGL